jgi:hypothetical protein
MGPHISEKVLPHIQNIFHPEGGGRKFFRNVGTHLLNYKELHPKKTAIHIG